MRFLVAAGLDPNAATDFGTTPLHYARSREVFEALLELGADVSVIEEVFDWDGEDFDDIRIAWDLEDIEAPFSRRALSSSVRQVGRFGDAAWFARLREINPEFHAIPTDPNRPVLIFPLHYAARYNEDPAAVGALIGDAPSAWAYDGVDVNSRGGFGRPLEIAARSNGNPAVVRELLALGAYVNVDEGEALYAAAQNETPRAAEIVRVLLEAGAAVNGVEPSDGRRVRRPVYAAAMTQNLATLDALIAAGADVNVKGSTPDYSLLADVLSRGRFDCGYAPVAARLRSAGARAERSDGEAFAPGPQVAECGGSGSRPGGGSAGPAAGETWTSPLGMEFVGIPAGSFVMGSPQDEEGRDLDEVQHEVRISRGFWMGKYEVTQGQWEAVMGANPSGFDRCGARCPVEQVSWEDVQGFIRRLNERESGNGYEYRLPTEAEWEYAARAGTTGARHGELDSIAWYGNNSGFKAHPVGQKRANAWGLHDVLGNVQEWTADWYGGYPSSLVTDPQGPGTGSYRVLRGGSCLYAAGNVRSALRNFDSPGGRNITFGLRMVRTVGTGGSGPGDSGTGTGGGDDHGDSDSAATAVQLGSSIAGSIDTLRDSDWFRFRLDRSAIVEISLVGNGTGAVYVADIDGSAIIDDIGVVFGPPVNSPFRRSLAAGTYYVSVIDYDEVGEYTLHVRSVGSDTGGGSAGPGAGETWTNTLGMEFVGVPAGSFVMGSPQDEEGRRSDERQHEVRISRGFWMGKYEVTQGQWEAVMGANPSFFFDECGVRCPVETVSWEDVQEFIRRLNARETGRGYVYRLPTEAEWEYAARAGTTGVRYGELDSIAWYSDNSDLKTHPVGEKRANEWGLYDMLGNVWEWTADWYGDYPSGAVSNPRGPGTGSSRVARGGSSGDNARGVRSAGRLYFSPGNVALVLGFRLVREVGSAEGSGTSGTESPDIEVVLGGSGESVTLRGTEGGGYTLDGKPVSSGAVVDSSTGARYRLVLGQDGTWMATLVPTGGGSGGGGAGGVGELAVLDRLEAANENSNLSNPLVVEVGSSSTIHLSELELKWFRFQLNRSVTVEISVTGNGTGVAVVFPDGDISASDKRRILGLTYSNLVEGSEDPPFRRALEAGTYLVGLMSILGAGEYTLHVRSLGGDSGGSGTRGVDDHGDSSSTATEVQVGSSTAGTLDGLELDWFRFRLERSAIVDISLTPAEDEELLVATVYRGPGPHDPTIDLPFEGILAGFPTRALLAPDTYYIVVTGGFFGVTEYTLHVLPGDGSTGGGSPGPRAGETWTNTLGMEFVGVPAGSFVMGSPEDEEGRDGDERQHGVRISRGFWMGKYEVTQGEYEAVLGENPSHHSCGARCPVDSVSWFDVQRFIQRLNERESGTGYRYRLPTEAEWEYAARARTSGARYGALDSIAWHGDNSGRTTHPVGLKRANAWGLHDMLGNVWEWTADLYGPYPSGSVTDPVGPLRGSGRVARGGSWYQAAGGVRSAIRAFHSPGSGFYILGFRLVREVESAEGSGTGGSVPSDIEVVLGGSGESVRLRGTEGGGYTLDGEPVSSGAVVRSSTGARYRLVLGEDGMWTATLVPTGGGGSGSGGRSAGTATAIEVGSSLAGRIVAAGEVDYFRFEVGEAARVAVYTTGSTDTVGRLDDSVTDDDGGQGYNFRIEASVAAGAHIVQVYGYGSETGDYVLHVRALGGSGGRSSGRSAGESWTNSLGMEFVSVPAGSFVMGSPEDEEGRDSDERQHGVRISRGFLMGKYEVTQGQWEAVLGENPSHHNCGARCPVDSVSWHDVQAFIQALNGRESGSGYRYRLPTEAEWEYAARAGTSGARYGELDSIAWHWDNSGRTTHPVGLKRANAWGLHDMLGNVWEWTADLYGQYPSGSVTDPVGPWWGSDRVARGGSWGQSAGGIRSAARASHSSSDGFYILGFRLVRTAESAGGSGTGGTEPPDIEVVLGGSGESVTLRGTDGGGHTLDGEPVSSGAVVRSSTGAKYRLVLGEDGTWTATLVSTGGAGVVGSGSSSDPVVVDVDSSARVNSRGAAEPTWFRFRLDRSAAIEISVTASDVPANDLNSWNVAVYADGSVSILGFATGPPNFPFRRVLAAGTYNVRFIASLAGEYTLHVRSGPGTSGP